MRGSIHQTSAVDGRCLRHSPLETGQPAATLHEFEAALEQTPNRYRTKSICKEIALQRPKSGKFDYLSGPNHPAHSIVLEFFTDD
jgi:hypothetical protein